MALDKLDQLRTFLVVANTLSFSGAARILQVSTNAVSLRIRQLEEALDAQLFVRTTRNVTLTEEGRTLYSRASPLLAELEDLEQSLDSRSDDIRGTVTLGLPSIVAGAPFLNQLVNFLEKYPRLIVHTRVTNSLVMPTAEGLDIVVASGLPADSHFVAKHLGKVAWVLAAAPSYAERHGLPATPDQLHNHRCLRLLTNPPQDTWTLTSDANITNGDDAAQEIIVPVMGNYQSDDSRVLGDALYAGLGIGLRSARECAVGEANNTLVRVLPEYHFKPLDVYALLPRSSVKLPRISICLEALAEAMKEIS